LLDSVQELWYWFVMASHGVDHLVTDAADWQKHGLTQQWRVALQWAGFFEQRLHTQSHTITQLSRTVHLLPYSTNSSTLGNVASLNLPPENKLIGKCKNKKVSLQI